MSWGAAGCGLIDRFGGAFERQPADMERDLSSAARRLLDDAFRGFEPGQPTDFHVHIFTRDVHPWWTDPLRPTVHGRFLVYMSAAGVKWNDTIEEDYIARLVDQARHFPVPGRFYLYAMDHTYRPDGTRDDRWTEFYVSNETIFEIAQQHPDIFVPVISVHPYRPDALDELRRWAEQGARQVKWLPNTQGMNPSDPAIVPFYEIMRAYDMVLLSHTGDEHAIAWQSQELGNPQLLQLPLEMGVKVVALHAASHGHVRDYDDPRHRCADAFDLLLRMMDDPRWDELLYADLSAVIFFNHLERPLRVLLGREDLHHRLINGSDYPLCAVNFAVRPRLLARHGFITREEALLLEELYHFNPLLFDFVIKRTVRHPETGRGFADTVFIAPDALR
jgi:uncharacterized protein